MKLKAIYRLLDEQGALCEETEDLAVVGSFAVAMTLDGLGYSVEVIDDEGRYLTLDADGNVVLRGDAVASRDL
jgi:hypothetical protein